MRGQGKLVSASPPWSVWDGLPRFDVTPPAHEFLLKVLSGIVKKANYETTEQCL